MKKDLAIIGGLFLVVAILVIFGRSFTSLSVLPPRSSPGLSVSPDTTAATSAGSVNILIRNLNISAEVANTFEKRKEGLSKYDTLPLASGMLFVFENSEKVAIWMKDMKFAIDIFWLDQDKKIVYIVNSAVPERDKDDNQLTIYRPPTPAKYVLEVNAGLANLNNVQVGDTALFELR